MSSPFDQRFATQFVARLSHDLANVLLPLRAVADLPASNREEPRNVERLWAAVDDSVVQLTRINEQLRAICRGETCELSELMEPQADQRPLPHRHVLVVEDQEIVRRAIVYLLQEAGQSCDVADTARAAEERLQLESFDLVLLDRNLPDMKAEQLAIQIHHRKPTLPLVLITGDDVGAGDHGVRWTGGEGHFTAMIAKPLTLSQLRWLLAQIAEGKTEDESEPSSGERSGS